MRHENFEEVSQLDIDARRMLLDHGEHREKLWVGWFGRMVVLDSREADMEERKDGLVSRLRELNKETGLDFLTETFVSWASGFPKVNEIVFELGKRMYYAT